MSDKHLDPKDLKKPDAFQVQGFKTLSWIETNAKLLIGIILPFPIVFCAFFAWNYFSERSSQKLRDELASIDMMYQQEEEAVSKPKEALQKEMQDFMKVAKSDQKLIDAKMKELQEKMTLIKADHSGSLEKYEAFSKLHSDKPAGWRAGLQAANIVVQKNDYPKAIEILKPIIEKAQLPLYQTQGRIYYAGILEETGKKEEALLELDKALGLKPNDELAAYALMAKGRILHETGKNEDALKAFDEILSKYAETSEAEKAKVARSIIR
jgi:predicted negative regulator of RcsB-dependent stress response